MTDSTGAEQAQAEADFMGLAVRCARGAAVCSRGSVPDALPAEPGGYSGYRALFGNKFIQPAISPSGPVSNLTGQVIEDSFGQLGFPGYDGMTGPNGLQENAAFGTFFSTLAAQGVTTPFAMQSDAAPSIYVNGQPGRTTSTARSMEQAAATLTGPDLATGQPGIAMTNYPADPVELQILHMVTADPKRTPTFTVFGNDTFWQENDPTMLALLGLQDDYAPESRVLGEIFTASALPVGQDLPVTQATELIHEGYELLGKAAQLAG